MPSKSVTVATFKSCSAAAATRQSSLQSPVSELLRSNSITSLKERGLIQTTMSHVDIRWLQEGLEGIHHNCDDAKLFSYQRENIPLPIRPLTLEICTGRRSPVATTELWNYRNVAYPSSERLRICGCCMHAFSGRALNISVGILSFWTEAERNPALESRRYTV